MKIMAVESDMNNPVSQVVNALGMPFMISTSSQSLSTMINRIVDLEMEDRKLKSNQKGATNIFGEKEERLADYLDHLINNSKMTNFFASHCMHFIMCIFPNLSALSAWSVYDSCKSELKLESRAQVLTSFVNHCPTSIFYHLKATIEIDGWKLQRGSVICTSPALELENDSESVCIEDVIGLPCSKFVIDSAVSVLEKTRGVAAIENDGELRIARYSHLGMPWAQNVLVSIQTKEE